MANVKITQLPTAASLDTNDYVPIDNGSATRKYNANNFGQVNDVKVNGTSVVTNKTANVTVPTKVSDLENDSEFTTEDEVNLLLADKQDNITDLDDIRSGAALGETALQDAPSDDKQYARKNGEWTEVSDDVGQVNDVKVNGTSVVTNKVAYIIVPTIDYLEVSDGILNIIYYEEDE